MRDRRFSYSLTIEGVVFDITPITDSSSLSVMSALCSTKKKSAKNNMSVSLKGGANPTFYATFMQALLESQANNTIKDCLFIVADTTSNTVMFSGYLDSSEIEINSKHFPDSLELSAMDKTMLLDNKIRVNRHWENTSRNQIVEDLIDAMEEDTGKTISLLSTELSDTDKIGNYSVTEDMDKTYRDIIDLILFEAVGYVIVYDPQNDGYRIKRIPTTLDGNTTYREVKYMVENGLKTKSVLYENDGILLSYPTIVTRQNTNLYFENISLKTDDNGKLKGDTVYYGQYYPKDGDVKAIHQNYRIADRPYVSGESRLQNEDLKLLYAKDVSYELASNPQLSLAPALPNIDWDGTPKFYPNKAWILFRNDNSALYIASEDTSADDSKTYYSKSGDIYTPIENPSSDANPKQNGWYEEQGSNVTTFSLTGTAIYVDYMNKLTVPNLCQNPEEYEVQTITDADKAKAFAQWYYNSQRYGGTTSQWNEPEGYSTLGEIVYVVHKETGIQMPHVIVQMTDECAGGASGTIRMKKVVAISLYGWQEYTASKVTANQRGSNTSSEQTPSRWTNGTALWGESVARGWEGNVGDYYLNTENYNLYRCTTSGTSSTALWTYVGNIKGEDANISANTYTIEYSLSTSPSEYLFPIETINYTEEDDFGSIDNDPNSSTYGQEISYGLRDQVWTSSPEGWYKGLYVWQRLKTTDANGEVTYGEPTYAKSTTEALINGCILEIVLTDYDGDGNTHTWEKKLSDSVTDITILFRLVARSYSGIASFKSALQGQSPRISFIRASEEFLTVDLSGVTPSSESFDSDSNLAVLEYAYSFKKNMNADSLVINVDISDTYLDENGSSYTIETKATASMTAVDVTEYDAFGGIFDSDSSAEAFFYDSVNGYNGLITGYTYSMKNPSDPDHYLAMRTYIQGVGWEWLTQSGFSNERISRICGKAQKSILSQIEEGTVTATDYGYFNVLVAKIVTADFIGSKQIELQEDDEGNAGVIYGGSVNPSNPVGSKTSGKGFYFDSDGNAEVNSLYVKGSSVIDGNSIVKGSIDNVNEDDGKPVFTTNKDSSSAYYMASSKIDGTSVPSAYSYNEWKSFLTAQTASLSDGTLYTATGQLSGYWNGSTISTASISHVKRLSSVSSEKLALFTYGTGQSQHDVTQRVFTNNQGKKILLTEVRITPQSSKNLFGKTDRGDTQIRVYDSNGNLYRDYGVNDDSGATYYNVDVPMDGYIVAYWGRSTAYTFETLGGSIIGYCIESDNWSVGVNIVNGNGTNSVLLSALIPSSGFGTSNEIFYCGSIDSEIFYTANSVWDVKKYYNFAWTTLPYEVGTGTQVLTSINTSYIDTYTFTYDGNSLQIGSVLFSPSTLKITTIDGNEYLLSSGYHPQYDVSITTLAELLGAKARNLMPVWDEDNNQRIGNGFVGTQLKPWYAVYSETGSIALSQRSRKENIEEYFGDAVELMKSVKICSFRYKSDHDNPDGYTHYGFIADDTDERLSSPSHNVMEMGNCIGLLIKAVQELSAEIERLKNGGEENEEISAESSEQSQ